MLIAYSKKRDGNINVGTNFKVKEFACKDGSDTIFIDTLLVSILQKVRNNFNCPVTITSGFRTESYNNKIGGARYSQHKYGTAADIKVKGVKPKEVAKYLETLIPNHGGIGIYPNFVHVDIRYKKTRWRG